MSDCVKIVAILRSRDILWQAELELDGIHWRVRAGLKDIFSLDSTAIDLPSLSACFFRMS